MATDCSSVSPEYSSSKPALRTWPSGLWMTGGNWKDSAAGPVASAAGAASAAGGCEVGDVGMRPRQLTAGARATQGRKGPGAAADVPSNLLESAGRCRYH